LSTQSAKIQYTPERVWPLVGRYLPATLIEQWLIRLSLRFYRRLYTPWVVVWGFIYQRLHADHTCDAFVSYLTSGGATALGLGTSNHGQPLSENTAAYCKARQRLPSTVAKLVVQHIAQVISSDVATAGQWQGRQVNLLDGSTVRLPAEEELLVYYGQPSGQHGKSHWPRMRVVAAFDLFSGAVTGTASGPYRPSEHALAIRVIRQAQAAVIWVGDQLFGIYHLVQVVVGCNQDAVFRIQASHIGRWCTGSLASGSDLDVVWSPSAIDQLEPDLPAPAIAGRLLYVRIAAPGFRPKDIYLFTTLTDRIRYPAQAIVQLYARRWEVELDLRQVKTTLEMEFLTGKTVAIIENEWLLGLAAYNLIRALMAQAAIQAGLQPLRLSFVRCWRRIVATSYLCEPAPTPTKAEHQLTALLQRLATCRLPQRSRARYEPRAVRKRPQLFPYLKGSREAARQAHIELLKNKS
jgi:hypothetical protein